MIRQQRRMCVSSQDVDIPFAPAVGGRALGQWRRDPVAKIARVHEGREVALARLELATTSSTRNSSRHRYEEIDNLRNASIVMSSAGDAMRRKSRIALIVAEITASGPITRCDCNSCSSLSALKKSPCSLVASVTPSVKRNRLSPKSSFSLPPS